MNVRGPFLNSQHRDPVYSRTKRASNMIIIIRHLAVMSREATRNRRESTNIWRDAPKRSYRRSSSPSRSDRKHSYSKDSSSRRSDRDDRRDGRRDERRERSPRGVERPSSRTYNSQRRRSRSCSRSQSRASNMDISSNDEVEDARVFHTTFQPIAEKTVRMKISVPKSLPRDSPEEVEVDYHGYKIRNAPEEGTPKRRSRWEAESSGLSQVLDIELLAKQGMILSTRPIISFLNFRHHKSN